MRERSGLHRLILARVLGLRAVPCVLFAVHPAFSRTTSDLRAVLTRAQPG